MVVINTRSLGRLHVVGHWLEPAPVPPSRKARVIVGYRELVLRFRADMLTAMYIFHGGRTIYRLFVLIELMVVKL